MNQLIEEWKDVDGYSGYYSVSTYGRVRNNKRMRILKQKLSWNGYPTINLNLKGKGKTCRIHRLLAVTFFGEPPPKIEVNHKDGNKLNNNISNLEFVTRFQNIIHAYTNGLHKGHGETHYLTKLNQKQVTAIRHLRGRMCLEDVAEIFGVCKMTVSNIQRGLTWKHVI